MRVLALLQALFVTFLWSTSWVLIKIGLDEIPALVFAGLRYGLAFLLLLPATLLRPTPRAALRTLSPRSWATLAALGVLLIALTQGAPFVALSLLPTVTVSLILSFSPVLVVTEPRFLVRSWCGGGGHVQIVVSGCCSRMGLSNASSADDSLLGGAAIRRSRFGR